MSGDYQGKINFESVLEYDKPGNFEPATPEHAQKNTPKPKKPSGMDDKSIRGLRDAIAYTAATIEYAFNTGDYSLVEQGVMTKQEKDYFFSKNRSKLDETREGKNWPDNIKITYTLDEGKPREDDGIFRWNRTFEIDYGTFEVNDGEATELYKDGARVTKKFEGYLKARYKDGAWEIIGVVSQIEEEESDSNSGSNSNSDL